MRRVLFISHNSVVAAYRQKLCELAKYPDIEVHVLAFHHLERSESCGGGFWFFVP
jgi:hypothetical protein